MAINMHDCTIISLGRLIFIAILYSIVHFYTCHYLNFSYGGRLPRGSVYRAFGFTCGGNEAKVINCSYTGAVCDLGENSDIIAIACL